MEELELNLKWRQVLKHVHNAFPGAEEVQDVLYLIGLQELGKSREKFSKDQKVDIIHVAVCTVLMKYGYFLYKGRDEDGWPHWEATQKLPHLSTKDQEILMKSAVIEYFDLPS